MKIARKKQGQRIVNLSLAFCLALSTVSASVPFISSEKAAALSASNVIYNSSPAVSPQTNYTSLGYQATSTSQLGDYIHLGGTNRILDTVTVTMSDWAKYSDYSSDARYSSDSTNWSHPVTVNVYSSHLGANGAPDTLLGSKTQSVSIPWRPETPGYAYNGVAFNAVFDLSGLGTSLPSDVIIGVAYNTQTYGATPLGVAGPYNSLNVAVPASQTVSVGSDNDADAVFLNSTWSGAYSSAGTTGVFRNDTSWAPYGTLGLKITATTLDTPTNLTPLNGVSTNDTAFSMTWDAVSGASKYEYKTANTLSNPTTLGTIIYSDASATASNYDITPTTITRHNNGTPQNDYYWQVRAGDNNGNWSDWSVINKVTVDTEAPATPVHQYPSDNAVINTNDFWFDWNDVTGAVKYETQYSQNPSVGNDGAFQNVAWTGDYQNVQPTDSKAHSVGANGTWYWQVRALDAAGNKSAWSTPWKLTIDMEAPSAPNVSATGVANNAATKNSSVEINWTKPSSDTAKYDYRVWTNAAGSQYNSVASAYLESGLTGNSRTGAFSEGEGSYFVQVRAIDAAGNVSGWSNTFTVIYDATAPAVPVHASPANGVVGTTAGQTLVDWNDVSDPNGVTYIYQSSTSSATNTDGSFVSPVYTSSPLTGSEIPTPNTPEGTYYWHVKAVDGAGNASAWSAEWKIVIDNTAPSLSLDSVDTSSNTSRTITGATDPFAEVTVTVHSTPQTKVTTADVNGNWSVTFDGLEVGPHIVTVSSKDTAGNVTPGQTQNFEVTAASTDSEDDTSAPQSNNPSTNRGQSLVAVNSDDSDADDSQPASTDSDNGEVLAAQDVKKDVAATTGAIKNSDGTWGVLGIAWYWILAALAVIAIAWWLIAAARRRRNEA